MRRNNLNLKTVRSLVKFPIRVNGTRAQYIVDVDSIWNILYRLMPNLPHSDLDHSIRSFRCSVSSKRKEVEGVSWELEEAIKGIRRITCQWLNAMGSTRGARLALANQATVPRTRSCRHPLKIPTCRFYMPENMSTSVCEGFTSNASSRRKITY